ncbi:glycosyltransferase [Lacinutrix undariae]
MSGLFVLCSDNCGAQELIKNKFNGIIFSHKKENDLCNALKYCVNEIDLIRDEKEKILKWSKCIEGSVVAKHFVKALKSDTIVTPPWCNIK